MRRILRQPISFPGASYVHGMLPGPVVAVGIKHDEPNRLQLWWEAQDALTGGRSFEVVPTGAEVPDGAYLGTVLTPANEVWHVYEVSP